jgi:hypothetical protein
MDDSLAVGRCKSLRDLQRVVRGLAHRQRRAVHLFAQCVAPKQFADEIGRAFIHAGIVNRKNVWMIQGGQRLRLLLETAQSIRVRREILRQYLHRHVAIEPRVPRAKYFTHSAHADGGGDAVLVERRADHFRGGVVSMLAFTGSSTRWNR